MRIKPDPKDLAEVYIDESSQTQHRYLVLGGIVIHLTDTGHLTKLIQAARLPELPANEAKWTKVSAAKLAAYVRMTDVLFDNPRNLHFHSLVIDTHKVDHNRFNNGDREIGFNKEIYQLAMKFGRLYPSRLFHVYPDYRETTQAPDDLRVILNRGCQKKGDPRDWPFRRVQFRDSKQSQILQLTDIMSGALGFRLNGHALKPDASKAKIALADHIFRRAKIDDVTKDTAKDAVPYSIWHRQLR